MSSGRGNSGSSRFQWTLGRERVSEQGEDLFLTPNLSESELWARPVSPPYLLACSFTQLLKQGIMATIQLSTLFKGQIQPPRSIGFTS